MTKKEKARIEWNREFARQVSVLLNVANQPNLDWDTATYLFNQKNSPLEAALKYTKKERTGGL